MKKLLIILALLLSHFNSNYVQGLNLEFPVISIINDIHPETGLAEIIPERVADGTTYSWFAIPYEGLLPDFNYRLYIVDYNIRRVFGDDVHFDITGINEDNPSLSKGMVYMFFFEYKGTGRYIELYDSQGNVATISQYPPGMCPVEKIKCGIEIHYSGGNPYLCISGPEFPPNRDLSLRKVIPDTSYDYWPQVTSFSTSTIYSRHSDPDGNYLAVIPLDAEYLQKGSYVLCDFYGTIASNATDVYIDSESSLEWLDQPGESSPTRVCTLNKNGDIYTTRVLVPSSTDISNIVSILNDNRYRGAIVMSLKDITEYVDDFALTFEVRCFANTSSEERSLCTGFSDIYMSGVPNKFIQPGDGTYESLVEVSDDAIIIQNHEIPDFGYYLFDASSHSYARVQVDGDDYNLRIMPTQPGIYYLAAVTTSTATQIGNNINFNVPEFFTDTPHLSHNESLIEMGPDSLIRTVTFKKDFNFNRGALDLAVQQINATESSDHSMQRMKYEVLSTSKDSCTIKLIAPLNTTKSDRIITAPFIGSPDGLLQIKLVAGDSLQIFDVTGSWHNTLHPFFDITLSGSQEGVCYTLLQERELPTTPVINRPIAELHGTGQPIRFERITQQGVYKVVVRSTSSDWVEMSGVANMCNSADGLVANTNWTKTKSYRNGSGTLYNESAIHYDGLGRPVQKVSVGAGGNGNDIIQMVVYDNMGRDDAEVYLPYSRPSYGSQMSKYAPSEQSAYYAEKFPDDPDRHYPLSRMEYCGTKVMAYETGSSGADHPVEQEVRLNDGSEGIRKYVMAIDGTSIECSGMYGAGKLSVRKTSKLNLPSDQQAESYTYTDSQGQVVAEETRVGIDRRITYYVYDDMGRQRYIIPAIQEEFIANQQLYSLDELRRYCYYNEYDKYGNIIVQYIPGSEPIYNIYDKRGRLVMSQSGNQRAGSKNEWSYTKYDAYDRPVLTGLYNGGTYDEHRLAVDTWPTISEARTGNIHGYTSNSYPTDIDADKVLFVTYYDDYVWLGTDSSYSFSTSDALDAEVDMQNVVGLQTGTKTKVLGITDDKWLTSVSYYNSKYQAIQSIIDLYPSGKEVVSNVHNFVGDVIQTKVKQTTGTQNHGYTKWFDFDNNGRLNSIRQKMDGDAAVVTIASYTYDDMGNMSEKNIHDNLETTTLTYDIIGRQTGVNSPSFSYNLWFDKAPHESGLSGRHDGKLAHVTWGNNLEADQKGYTFKYDGFGQLSTSEFLVPALSYWVPTKRYAELGWGNQGIAYDKNGNIQDLVRKDEVGRNMHAIQYLYENPANGNALSQTIINGDTSAVFMYDLNGNMITDGSTGVQIEYNVLNKPERVFAGNDEIRYIYSAGGEKLATVAPDGSLTYYRSVFTYAALSASSPETLLHVMHPEGIVQREGSAWTYKYFKTDHVGSTRVLLAARGAGSSAQLTIEQETDYYPFGLAHGSLNNLHLNRYLYGGKEYQDASLDGSMLGLYDFHARFYNPMLGRWFNPDPALQTSNPYNYCGNNPMMYMDEDGEWVLLAAAIVGAYLGGSGANHTFNPFKWDYSSGATWAGMIGGAIQGMASVAGIQAGFAQMGWSGMAQFGRSAGAAKFLTGTIKTASYANGWAKVGVGIAKGLVITNAAMKSLNTIATVTSAIANIGNAGRIIMGNYYYNPRRTVMGQIWEGISRGSHESIQQGFGSVVGHIRNTCGDVSDVEFFNGATLVNNNNENDSGHRWGMTMGSIINSQNLNANTDDAMFMHEYGHTQQSKLLGPLYPFVIAIPSGFSAMGSEEAHAKRWYEKSANRHARRYFNKFHNNAWENNPRATQNDYPIR
ncbi:RHS repeat-associated core domain-containing protein [Alistipes sp. OttesenSCG-928-B03]|nr:RHS repeat-associated core domain-containing protein [Alistipes sp. OttesenSCG-928-B03]